MGIHPTLSPAEYISPYFEGYLTILILVECIIVQTISVRCRDVNQGGEKEKIDYLSYP